MSVEFIPEEITRLVEKSIHADIWKKKKVKWLKNLEL